MAQLRGHSIAVQEGTVEQYFLVAGAGQKAHIPYSAVQIDNLTLTDASTAVANGQVDAAVISQPLTGLDEASGKIRVLATGAGVSETIGYLTASDAALANPQKAAALSDFIQRYYRAETQLKKNPLLAAETYVKTYGVPLAVAKEAVASDQVVGTPITPAIISYQQNEANTFQKLGLVAGTLNVKQIFDLPLQPVAGQAGGPDVVTLQAARTGLVPVTPTPQGAPGTAAAAPGPDPLPAPDAAGLVRLETGAPGRRPRRWAVALRLLVPVSIFAAWWILTVTGAIPSTTLSTPAATWDAFVELWRHQDLVGDIGVSARRAVFGLALGASIGLILGIVVGLTRLGEELVDASMQMLRMVPYPAVIFLFIIWFGIGEMAKVLLIGLATLFPMYLNASNGVRNVDRRVVEAARSFGVKGWQLVRRVVVPLAMPSIMTGLRFSAGISVIALVFTESIGANQGIGYLVAQANSLQQISILVVCILIYALFGIVADISVRLLERVTMPWRRHQAVR